MAIYHLSVKPISRSSGRSSTGAAAYRSAEKVIDSRTGEIFDYTRKRGVEFSEIVTPSDATWKPSRSELWNAAELAEKRKDACVAREHEIALPAELSADDRLELARMYAKDLADRHGCAVDLAIHAPHQDKDGKSNNNYHAHLLCTTRQVEGEGLGQKCAREKAGRNRKADLEDERALWADHQNTALELAGFPQVQVDHRSLAAQGIERQPTTHLGPAVTAMQRDGRPSDVLDRLTAAREAGERERAEAKALDGQILDLTGDLLQALAERNHQEQQNDRLRAAALGRIGANLSAADRAGQRAAAASQHLGQADRRIAEAGRNQRARRAEEVARTAGLVVGRAVAQVARTAGKAVAIHAQHQAEQARIKAQMVKTIITPSEPLSPAKPQQSAREQAREALAQAAVARASVGASRIEASGLSPEQLQRVEEAKAVREHERQIGRTLNRWERLDFLKDRREQAELAKAQAEIDALAERNRQEQAAHEREMAELKQEIQVELGRSRGKGQGMGR